MKILLWIGGIITALSVFLIITIWIHKYKINAEEERCLIEQWDALNKKNNHDDNAGS